MMMISFLLAILLAPAPKPITIFVGPMAQDGFVDANLGVSDSIKDIQDELRKNRMLAVVSTEANADLRLYVISRGKVAGTGTPVQIGTAQVVGGVVIGSGVTVTDPDSRIDALLRVENYEKAFFGQSDERLAGTWRRAAKLLVKDLLVWVTANRERLSKP